MTKLTKNEQFVLKTIKANPGVQDDEHKLLEAVWLAQGWKQSYSLYYNLTFVTHAETVARARRKLHEIGLIEYSPNALRRRTKRYKQETERLGTSVTQKIVYGHSNSPEVKGRIKIITAGNGEKVAVFE